jgi:DNA-binding transcriptional ArsR family regulator
LDVTTTAAVVDVAWAALADPVRRRAVELLAERPRRAGELAALVGVSAPTMSKHLRVLRQGGLVSDTHPEFDTRVRVYALHAAAFTGLRRWLEQAERGWCDQLDAFGAHVRQQHEP